MFPIKLLADGRVKIHFNSDFYSMYSVSEICEKFQHLFRISLEYLRDTREINVYFQPKVKLNDEQFKSTILEFLNHTLHEEISLTR